MGDETYDEALIDEGTKEKWSEGACDCACMDERPRDVLALDVDLSVISISACCMGDASHPFVVEFDDEEH